MIKELAVELQSRAAKVQAAGVDAGILREAADHLRWMREWIISEGERTNTCTAVVLGERCAGCKCAMTDEIIRELHECRAAKECLADWSNTGGNPHERA